jgi:hypothetical protein
MKCLLLARMLGAWAAMTYRLNMEITRLIAVLLLGAVLPATYGSDRASARIDELKLTNGTTLHDVEFVSFGTNTVMARWNGGKGTIAYSNLPASVLDKIAALRPEPPKPRPLPTIGVTEPKLFTSPVRVLGQVYVITRGAGAYKIPGESVYAYPCSDFAALVKDQIALFQKKTSGDKTIDFVLPRLRTARSLAAFKSLLGQPIETTTDADGKFELNLPAGAYIVLCYASRDVVDYTERYLWALPVTSDRMDLTSRNQWIQPD